MCHSSFFLQIILRFNVTYIEMNISVQILTNSCYLLRHEMTASKIPRLQGASHKWPDCFVWSFPWRQQCVKRPCLFKASTGILLLKIVLRFSESLVSFCAALTWGSSLFTVMDDGTCLLVDRSTCAFSGKCLRITDCISQGSPENQPIGCVGMSLCIYVFINIWRVVDWDLILEIGSHREGLASWNFAGWAGSLETQRRVDVAVLSPKAVWKFLLPWAASIVFSWGV